MDRNIHLAKQTITEFQHEAVQLLKEKFFNYLSHNNWENMEVAQYWENMKKENLEQASDLTEWSSNRKMFNLILE